MANCNYKVKIKDIQNKYTFKIFSAPRGEKGDTGATGEIGTPLVASSVSGMTDTTRNYINTTDGHWYYYDGTEWKDGGIYQAIGISENSITPEMTTFIDVTLGQNIFNPNSEYVVDKQFYSGSVGGTLSTTSNNNFMASIVKVKPNTQYTCSGISYYVYYLDEDKIILSRSTEYDTVKPYTFTTPNNCEYIAVNFKVYVSSLSQRIVSDVNDYMIVEGNTLPSTVIPYSRTEKLSNDIGLNDTMENEVIDLIENPANIVNITVGTNETYTTLKSAIESITDSSKNKIYNIYVKAGTYDLYQEFGEETYLQTLNSNEDYFGGLILPPYVNLIGVSNNPNDTIIKFEVTDALAQTYSTAIDKISPINCYGTNEIRNLKIIAKNIRYGIHDEDGSYALESINKKRVIDNCIVINNESNYGYKNAYSCGFTTGCNFKITNSKFISNHYAFTMHDRTGTSPSNILIENCFMTGYRGAIRLGSVSNITYKHSVVINNCSLSPCIKLIEESTGSGVGCHFIVTGSGNTKVPFSVEQNDTLQYVMFDDEIEYVYCPQAYSVGVAVQIGYYDSLAARCYRATNKSNFAGILLEINSNLFNKIKTKGFVKCSDINLSITTEGTLIGVNSNGELISINNIEDAIGYIAFTGWLYIY